MTNAVIRTHGGLRADMSNILVQEPMIASTALFMEHRSMTLDEPGSVACTNGTAVTVWPAFHRLQQAERAGVLLHEYLHAAFAHPLRGVKMKRRLGSSYRHDIMNVAADAIINEGIRNGARRTIKLPEGGIVLADIAKQAEAVVALTGAKVDHSRMTKVGTLTLEWMYDALFRLEEAAKAHRDQNDDRAQGPAGDDGTAPSDTTSSPAADGGNASGKEIAPRDWQRDQREKRLEEFLAQFNQPTDVGLDGLEGMTSEDVDDAIRTAGEKLRNAKAMVVGKGTKSLLEVLDGDIPQVGTPWEASFRTITQRHLARRRERRPTKPGRRVLTQEAMGLTHIVWSSGRRRPNVPRVVVVLDSSGSIRPEEFLRYLSEIQAMKRRTNAEVYAVVADAAVRSVRRIDDARDLIDVAFEGRAGTDFRPALLLAEEMEADLVVYLTDLMGTFPDVAPPFPVLWTLPCMEVPDGYDPPFGQILNLD